MLDNFAYVNWLRHAYAVKLNLQKAWSWLMAVSVGRAELTRCSELLEEGLPVCPVFLG